MSENPNIYLDDPDPLSLLLKRMDLSAEVYVNGDFCGTWAVNTAGSKRIPFHLIGAGNAWLHIDDSSPQQLAEKDLVLFPRDSQHIVSHSAERPTLEQINAPMTNDGATTQMICGFFEFKSAFTYPLLDALPEVVVLQTSSANQAERMQRLLDLMLLELSEVKPGNYAVVDHIAYLVFIEILRQQVSSETLPQGMLKALFDAKIGRALNAIHKNPQQAWTLVTLAEKANMSRSSFADKFSRLAGITPKRYLNLWRMAEARRLLSSSELSTAQIAEMSGYDSEAAFRKAFKSMEGQTPGDVRKAAHKG